jgi:translation initiation factor IF-1
MDVAITINGEKFDLDPSCNFSFSKSLKTKSGNACEVTAGMCSGFSPKNLFEVKCKDGSKVSIPILCKKESKILIESDQMACAKKRSSMKFRVAFRDQKFDFEPSCSFSFSKRFKTKEGIDCKLEAGMCSSFSPKNRFEVSCEDGSKGATSVQCP